MPSVPAEMRAKDSLIQTVILVVLWQVLVGEPLNRLDVGEITGSLRVSEGE